MNDEFMRRFFGTTNGARHNDPFFNMHAEFQRMFEEMDEMMSRFHYGNFSMIDNTPGEQPPTSNEESSSENLRDGFLKSSTRKPNEIVPAYRQPSFFESFFDYPTKNAHTDDFEEDLDKKIAREGFDKVFREDIIKNDSFSDDTRRQPFAHFQSFGQSSSVRRIQRPDGTIEEVKTVRDSDGKEVKTVTRIIGDKMHSVVEKRNKSGIEETEEIFQNFDHDKIDDFNKQWNGVANRNKAPAIQNESNKSEIVKHDSNREQEQKQSWLSKLFSKIF